MPRTLPAELTAAMDSGNFQPYFLLNVREVGAGIIEQVTPLYFKLSSINMIVKWARQNGSVYDGYTEPKELEFQLVRGVVIGGVNYSIASSYYYGVTQTWDGIYQKVNTCMLPAARYTAAADVTYETLLDTLCTNYSKSATFKNAAAAWLGYQFLGDGKTLTLNRASDILNILRQKYLIYACDGGNDEILFCAIATDTGTKNHDLSTGLFKDYSGDISSERRFLWRDEANTVHYDGDADDPLWNLGYLESTASPPTLHRSVSMVLDPIAPHLKYLTFDYVRFTFENYPPYAGAEITTRVQVEEEYSNEFTAIGWRIYIKSFDWANGTEGGPLPSTIEAATPYTPLNTSNFAGILSANDNNIQAALDTLDDHEHAGAGGDGWTAGTGTWSYSSADDPTFVISINADVTALIQPGDRIKLTQTTIKYFIVTAVGTYSGGVTLVTVYGGTDYDLANAAITNPYYSHTRIPFGFPFSEAKWRVLVTDTSNASQATPTASTYYNLGSISISVPIGLWELGYQVEQDGVRNAQTAADIYSTLSTTNNGATDADFTSRRLAAGASGNQRALGITRMSKQIAIASKTTYYLNAQTSLSSTTSIAHRGDESTTLVFAKCAYL